MSSKILVVDDPKLIAAAPKSTIDQIDDLKTVGVAHRRGDAL